MQCLDGHIIPQRVQLCLDDALYAIKMLEQGEVFLRSKHRLSKEQQ